jgi:hypothetical protein
MPPQSLESRIEQLERRVTILEQLPGRIDGLTLQIVQLREEMHAAFSASEASLEEKIRAGDEETRRVLREEIRAGDKEVMSHARVLYEDLKANLALIREALPPPRRKRR